jgi:hypothetical protein
MRNTTDLLKCAEHARALKAFINPNQLACIGDLVRGEEGQHWADKLAEYAERVKTMPVTYEQDGKGSEAIVYLHYFIGGCDWWITERDIDNDPHTPGQQQAFGYADIGYGPEAGYISIEELKECGVELDLYWTPKPWAEVGHE